MYQYSCVHTYIPTYLHTYIPTYLPTYLHTYIPTYLPTYLPTYIQTDRQTDRLHAYMHTWVKNIYIYISIHIYLYFHIYVYDIFEHSPIPSTLHFMAWHCITYVWIHIYSKCILYICVCVHLYKHQCMPFPIWGWWLCGSRSSSWLGRLRLLWRDCSQYTEPSIYKIYRDFLGRGCPKTSPGLCFVDLDVYFHLTEFFQLGQVRMFLQCTS